MLFNYETGAEKFVGGVEVKTRSQVAHVIFRDHDYMWMCIIY
jgi:hypothetical protein